MQVQKYSVGVKYKINDPVWIVDGTTVIKSKVHRIRIDITFFSTETVITIDHKNYTDKWLLLAEGYAGVDNMVFDNEDAAIKKLRERLNKK